MFQKGFRDKLKKKNRYASSVARLRCQSEMFEGEFRTVAQHLLSQICDALGIPLISFPSERWMRSIPPSCLYANDDR